MYSYIQPPFLELRPKSNSGNGGWNIDISIKIEEEIP